MLVWILAMAFFAALSMSQQRDQDPDEQPAQAPTQSPAQTLDQYPIPAAPASAEAARVTVRGQVRNALTGEPLPRALVRIEGDASTGALTDGQGRFEIPRLPVGPQIFQLRKPGYYDRSSIAGEADSEAAPVSEHNVLLADQMPNLNFTLVPAGSIHGQIVLSSGDPAQGIAVNLLRRAIEDGRAVWQTAAIAKANSEGNYRFAELTAGVYAIYTEPVLESEPVTALVEPGSSGAISRSGYASVFYPDARDLADAVKIQLSSGEQALANFALVLEPFHSVTAAAVFPRGSSSSSQAAANLSAAVLDASGHQLAYAAQVDPATNTIQVEVPEGAYMLLVSSRQQNPDYLLRGRDMITQSAQNAGLMIGSAQFSVAGHNIADLRIPLSSPPSYQVQLTVIHSEGETESPALAVTPQTRQTGQTGQAEQVRIEVIASQTGGWIADGLATSVAGGLRQGTNSAANLFPGSYWLRTFTASSGLCEQSFTAAGVNLAREPLAVSLTGAVPPLELTLRDDCAKLTLSLPQSLTASVPGEEPYYTVYVISDFDSTTGVEAMTLRPSTGGAITLDNLTPGSYRVYTFAAPLRLEYRNPAVLASLSNSGQSVTLSAGASGNLVLEVPERQ
jgi:hypothetical protein